MHPTQSARELKDEVVFITFSRRNEEAYLRWRDEKLSRFPSSTEALIVEICDLNNLSKAEVEAVQDRLKRANMAIYKSSAPSDVAQARPQVQALAARFGLQHIDRNPYADEDAITPLQVAQAGGRKLYIPYTNKAIRWHTDGYYNPSDRTVRAMILHCVHQAGEAGGENQLFDPELAYILMRDHDPDMIKAFTAGSVLTIPGNDMDDDIQRDDVTGPVFSVDPASAALHMRYTARSRHVEWAKDDATSRAVTFMHDILGGPYTFTHRLEAGEGLICNNVLHTRSSFVDGAEVSAQRLMLRARYVQRVQTSPQTV